MILLFILLGSPRFGCPLTVLFTMHCIPVVRIVRYHIISNPNFENVQHKCSVQYTLNVLPLQQCLEAAKKELQWHRNLWQSDVKLIVPVKQGCNQVCHELFSIPRFTDKHEHFNRDYLIWQPNNAAGMESKIFNAPQFYWNQTRAWNNLPLTDERFCRLIHTDNDSLTTLKWILLSALLRAGWPHLRSVPHNWGPWVSQLVSARPLIIMPQEDIALQLQNAC